MTSAECDVACRSHGVDPMRHVAGREPAFEGFAFRRVSARGLACRCGSGYKWVYRGEHECGCGGFPSQPMGPSQDPNALMRLFSGWSGSRTTSCQGDACCCINDVCVEALPGGEEARPLDGHLQVQLGKKDIMLRKAPIVVSMETVLMAEKGGPCRIVRFLEATQPWMPGTSVSMPAPGGYDPDAWVPGSWNDTTKHHAHWPSVLKQLDPHLKGGGSVPLADNIAIPYSFEFMQFFEMKSGCRSCKDCCVLVHAQSSADSASMKGVLFSVKIKCAAQGSLKCEPPSIGRPLPCVGAKNCLPRSPLPTDPRQVSWDVFSRWEPGIQPKQTIEGQPRVCGNP